MDLTWIIFKNAWMPINIIMLQQRKMYNSVFKALAIISY